MPNPQDRAQEHQALIVDPPAELIGRLVVTENALMLLLASVEGSGAHYSMVLAQLNQLAVQPLVPREEVNADYLRGFRKQLAVLASFR